MAKRSKRDLLKILGPAIAIPALAVGAAVGMSTPGTAVHAATDVSAGVAAVAVHQLAHPDYGDGFIPKPEAAAAPGCPGYEYNGCDTATSPRNTSWG